MNRSSDEFRQLKVLIQTLKEIWSSDTLGDSWQCWQCCWQCSQLVGNVVWLIIATARSSETFIRHFRLKARSSRSKDSRTRKEVFGDQKYPEVNFPFNWILSSRMMLLTRRVNDALLRLQKQCYLVVSKTSRGIEFSEHVFGHCRFGRRRSEGVSTDKPQQGIESVIVDHRRY